MAVFKCKMCGSDLYPEDGAGVVICDLCGSEQTLPKAADDKKTALFNKANAFRMKKRFDEALKLYAEIQAKYPDEADAHWGKLLCEYGIEYVDDVKTERKIPTCNRTLSVSIFDHPEYKAAMKKATAEEGEIYKREATEIDGYQKKILEIAKKEAPYDIFICFKELDSEGKRTKDSQLATKIYENLTKKNYKVFFSRVTLKSKVGSEYEPYIYAALQSAKVMLVLATKKEYVEAVWVRNEWSRYLGFMEADSGKSIVPCIKDIDAYDLPEALQDFQAQDMGELDFIENLTRAIDSKFGRGSYGESVPAPVVSASQEKNTPKKKEAKGDEMSPLLRRAFIHLQDGEWAQAHDALERLFDQEPENAFAYVAALMVDLQVKTMDGLGELEKPFRENANYKKAIRYGDDQLKEKLVGFNEPIEKNIIYAKAVALIKVGKIDSLQKAVPLLESIRGWKDSEELLASIPVRCEEIRKEAIYLEADEYIKSNIPEVMQKAIPLLESIRGWKDSEELLASIPVRCEEIRKEAIYLEAAEYIKSNIPEVMQKAIPLLESIRGWKDSEELLANVPVRCEEIRKEAVYLKACNRFQSSDIEKVKKAQELFLSIADWKDSQEKAELCKKRIAELEEKKRKEEALERERAQQELRARKRRKIASISFSSALLAIIVFIILLFTVIIPTGKFNKGTKLLEKGNYTEAIAVYDELIKRDNLPGAKITVENGLNYWGTKKNPYLYLLGVDDKNITTANIQDDCKVIADYAFSNCSKLTSVTIPEGVEFVGKNTFSGCSNLTDVTIPNSVTSISDGMFSTCNSLTSVSLPKGVKSIGSYAFGFCNQLTSIVIPDALTDIDEYAFYGCSSLTDIYITDVAAWCDISGLSNLTCCNSEYKSLYLNNELVTDLLIPNTVTKIKASAFYNCGSLKSVVLGNGVTSIGEYVFGGCIKLNSVEIPDSVTSIGNYAFYACYSLENIEIPNSVTSIGYAAFRACNRLIKIVIPDSVTSISGSTFRNCSSLISVTIPDSVTSIGDDAFYNCIGLTDVYYKGTEAAWQKIMIGAYNTALMNARMYYNS